MTLSHTDWHKNHLALTINSRNAFNIDTVNETDDNM